jgi:DNA-binding transcriptional regulator YdaS (Cro superfamily)
MNKTQLKQQAFKALMRLIDICGSQSELARRVRKHPRTICNWVHRNKHVPLAWVRDAAKASNNQMTEQEIRPDVELFD